MNRPRRQQFSLINKIVPIILAIIIFSSSLDIFETLKLNYSSLSFFPTPKLNDSKIDVFAQTQNIDASSADLAMSNLINQGSPYLGNKSATVTLIDFSDLQCHLCARYVNNTEPMINETYIQTGKVVLVFKHLPNRGADSIPAALAAQCIQDQGKFWQFHNLLYKNQGPIDSGWSNKYNLRKFALQIPILYISKFDSCFDNQKYKSFIENDIAFAHSLGFTETPSFMIVRSDGSHPQKIEGAQPFPAFKALIDKSLDLK